MSTVRNFSSKSFVTNLLDSYKILIETYILSILRFLFKSDKAYLGDKYKVFSCVLAQLNAEI